MLKTIIKIIITYKLNLIFIIYYEIKYIIFLKYKCNEVNIIKSKNYTDNIPTPYFFLDRIFNFIKDKKIKKFTDIGCGSGRVINFFSRKKSNLKIIGYEINKNIFLRTKVFFKNNNKIQIKNFNVLKIKKLKSSDVFYLADPFKKNKDYNKMVELISKSKKKMYIIVVNINNNLKVFKKYKIINQFQCNKLGYKIYTNK